MKNNFYKNCNELDLFKIKTINISLLKHIDRTTILLHKDLIKKLDQVKILFLLDDNIEFYLNLHITYGIKIYKLSDDSVKEIKSKFNYCHLVGFTKLINKL
ncbi:hypothetical protein HERIO_2056 [Hepatospora eriocheir]|uniref:Uncharacterized protein n=1 Tax=Hepatospora eriocheir TaxID=1081669 RepID=A0A1X0Q8E9_9MICR|nr:hypothetical protein HERIO_2056 [Hepatospora eriocheir]